MTADRGTVPAPRDTGASTPYDWDRYEDDFRRTSAYARQEAQLESIFATLPEPPQHVLEVGPGLGRITKMLVDRWPEAAFGLMDLSRLALEKTSMAVPNRVFEIEVDRIQHTIDFAQAFPLASVGGLFDLVVAIEVMLHIPPHEVEYAARNLLKAVKPGGHLVTCDWTEEIGREVRVQNYRHDYANLFNYIGATTILSERTGLQTIYVVQP